MNDVSLPWKLIIWIVFNENTFEKVTNSLNKKVIFCYEWTYVKTTLLCFLREYSRPWYFPWWTINTNDCVTFTLSFWSWNLGEEAYEFQLRMGYIKYDKNSSSFPIKCPLSNVHEEGIKLTWNNLLKNTLTLWMSSSFFKALNTRLRNNACCDEVANWGSSSFL
jgi:hypothetical protein